MRKAIDLTGFGAGAASLALLGLMAFCELSISSAQASVSWSDYPDLGPVSPNTLDYYFSSASLVASSGFTAQPSGGNPGSYLLSASGTGMNGASISLTLNNSDPVDLLVLTFDYAKGGFSGPANTMDWTYTISGGTTGSGDLGSAFGYLDLSGIGDVNAGSVITLTGTLSGATSGYIGFDNFEITSVPEPINYALAVFGLVFVGGGVGRFYMGRQRHTA